MIPESVRFINNEWFRRPVSPLERTLRLPRLAKEFLLVVLNRIFLRILFIFIGLRILSDFVGLKSSSALLVLLTVVFLFLWELWRVKDWRANKVMPQHLKKAAEIKKLAKRSRSYSAAELVKAIERVIDLEAWGLVRSVYVGGPSWIWEFLIKGLHPILVPGLKDYRDLLVGLPNKNTEADMALWKVSQIKDDSKRQKALEEFLEEYGSRVVDVDLVYPTLREQPEVIKHILKMYAQLEKGPKERFEEAKRRRLAAEKKVRPVFRDLVKVAQENVRLIEDRRFYEFMSDYDVRQILLELGGRLKLDKPESIFQMSWKEVRQRARKRS